MRLELMKKPRPGCTEIRTSSLHEDFWVVNKFLRTFLCPFLLGNTSIPQYCYQFWHSLIIRNKIDVSLMVIEKMKVSKHGGRVKKLHGLIFPRLITALLTHLGFQFEKRDEKVESFQVWSYEKVQKAVKQVGGREGLSVAKGKKGQTSTSKAIVETEDEDDDEEMEDIQGGEHGEGSGAQSDWDRFVGNQGPTQDTWGDYARQQGPSQGDWGEYARTQEPPQDTWRDYSRSQGAYSGSQGEWMQGVNTQLQGFGAKMDDMYSMVQSYGPMIQGSGSSIQGLDARVNTFETGAMGAFN